jgi:signal transduction histidine kinase
LADAVTAGVARWTSDKNVDLDNEPLIRALSLLGLQAVCAYGWAGEDGAGALIAAHPSSGQELLDAAENLGMAAAALKAAAQISEGIARLSQMGEKLQGGLSAAMQELSSTHDRLIKKSKEVKTLHEVAQALAASSDQGQSSLAAIVAIVTRAVEADLVAFLILDETTGELVTQPGAFGLDREEQLYRMPLTESRSSSVRVFTTREPFVTGDAQKDPSVISSYAELWKVHSLLVVPLIVEDRVLGVMRVGSRRRHAFGEEAKALIMVVAGEASVLVETAMLNRQLARTAEQLTALNRMKDDFVSTVSHEFKTPLTTMTGFLSVMLDGQTGIITDQQVKFLKIIRAAAKRLSGLVSDLLDLSHLEGGAKMDPQPLDMAALIDQSVENHQPAAADGGKTLIWTAPKGLPLVLGDGRWLGLVVDNLISNALKFSRAGGRVRIEASDKGEFLMIAVHDNGIGIPPQDQEKIFERFFRASNRAEVNAPGTGLGLAISREVDSNQIFPPCFEMTSLEMARPNPVPGAFTSARFDARKKRSKIFS